MIFTLNADCEFEAENIDEAFLKLVAHFAAMSAGEDSKLILGGIMEITSDKKPLEVFKRIVNRTNLAAACKAHLKHFSNDDYCEDNICKYQNEIVEKALESVLTDEEKAALKLAYEDM